MNEGWGPFQFPVMPEQASEHAAGYDALFWTITLLAFVFTAIVLAMVFFLAIRYRKTAKVDRSNPPHHNLKLELAWTFGPLVIALGIFVWSAKRFVEVRTMPEDAIEIYAVGKQWMWHFQHMDGTREQYDLTVPVGKPIKMTLISQDVIHAMYLPEMRAQIHVVPGRYTEVAFTPIKPGTYKILCAMHCGTQHSEMVGQLFVLDDKEYAEWKAKGGNRFVKTPKVMAEAGRQIYLDKGCGNCHTGVDNPRAPTLVGLMGKERVMTNGSSVTADLSYVRQSILLPHELINEGYENTMQAYHGQLSAEEVNELVEYIRTMSGGVGEYEPYAVPTSRATNDPLNTTDVANEAASAGYAAGKTEGRR